MPGAQRQEAHPLTTCRPVRPKSLRVGLCMEALKPPWVGTLSLKIIGSLPTSQMELGTTVLGVLTLCQNAPGVCVLRVSQGSPRDPVSRASRLKHRGAVSPSRAPRWDMRVRAGTRAAGGCSPPRPCPGSGPLQGETSPCTFNVPESREVRPARCAWWPLRRRPHG